MACGTVKWFDNTRGYGFITQTSGVEVFVHQTAILSANNAYRTLEEGEEVFFEILPDARGLKAINVQRQNVSNQSYQPAGERRRHSQRSGWRTT